MNIKLKAASYTAAYIAGCFVFGALFTAVDYFLGTTVAIGCLAALLFAYLINVVYNFKLRELERGE